MGGGSIISGGCGLFADPNECVKNSMQSWYIFIILFVLKLSTVSRVLMLKKKMKQIGAWNHNLYRQRRPHELESLAVSSWKPHGSVEASRVLEGAHFVCCPGCRRVVEVVRQERVDQEGGRGSRGRCYWLTQVWSLTHFFIIWIIEENVRTLFKVCVNCFECIPADLGILACHTWKVTLYLVSSEKQVRLRALKVTVSAK